MIIDSHCHLDFTDFEPDRDSVLTRAKAAGIDKIIIPGVMQSSWINIKTCCNNYSQLYPSYGLHPYFIDKHKPDDLQALKKWLTENKAVAIGECGLDYYLKDLHKKSQQFYFTEQLDIAIEFKLPVIIHARKSTEDVINAIKLRPGLRGMIHSYSGSYEQAVKLIELGFYLSFGGPITYDNSTRLRKTVASLPLENLLIETDAPDQPVASAVQKRNEPAFIVDVANAMAELHNTDVKTIARITSANTMQLFQLT